MHHFSSEHYLKTDLKTAWAFFTSPNNLAKITPADMDFIVLSDLHNKHIHNGMLIDYSVKPLFGIKMNWQTVILHVVPFKSFADVQKKGPYKIWKHTHIFTETEDGVLMKDEVDYKLPFGILGKAVNALIVKNKIKSIFDYRTKILNQIFNNE